MILFSVGLAVKNPAKKNEYKVRNQFTEVLPLKFSLFSSKINKK